MSDTQQQPDPVHNAAAVVLAQPQPSPSPLKAAWTVPPEPDKPKMHVALRIYSHSSLFYWWPVWVVGYVMALLTYWAGKPEQIEAIAAIFSGTGSLASAPETWRF